MVDPQTGTLIVGAGQAGVQLAVSLRDLGYARPVTVVGEEPHLPYQRPPLSKKMLKEGQTSASLALRPADFFERASIHLVRGEQIVSLSLPVDFPASAGEAVTDSGRRIPFDRLGLAVGGVPRRIAVPGAGLDRIRYLRGYDDAVRLREELRDANDVVVVGGGFVGLEVAAVVSAAGKRVTVLEAADRLMARAVAPVVSDFFVAAHRRRGMAIELDATVAGFRGDVEVRAVVLSDGTEVPADLVVVGIGLVPRVELAHALGLECEPGGIVVDARARTSRPGVVAAGDCTVTADPLSGARTLRLESVQNAVEQARQAASTLAGGVAAAASVPWFWSDQGSLKLQIAGLSVGYDDYVLRGSPDHESFTVLYYRQDRLIASDSVNAPRDYLAVRKALQDAANIPKVRAGDTTVALRDGASRGRAGVT